MISLLRRIRKKLVREGSLGPYFAYALGEVALIIVGILAALWIDGSNQDRKEARQEAFYLSGLRDEFALSLKKLDTLIAFNQRSYQTAKDLLVKIPKAETRQDEQVISQGLILTLAYEIAYNPNNALLREMINSGRLQLVSDAALRSRLMSWEPFLESINRQESNLRNLRENAMNVILESDGSIVTIMKDAGIAQQYIGADANRGQHSNLDILKSRGFENQLIMYTVTAEDTESNFYLPLRQEIQAILERIDKSLE